MRYHEEGLRAAGVVLARLLLGEAPDDAVRAHLSGRLIAMRKPNGKLRPLACGSVLRRLAAKGVCRPMATELRAAGGERQYGIGRKAGTEVMHKVLTILSEARPKHAFLSFDAKNAFNSMHRSAVRRAFAGTPLGKVTGVWYGQSTEHRYWDSKGRYWKVGAARGLDQGCPLSPGLFSAALAPCLREILSRLQQLDPHAEVYAYLDDIFVVIDAGHAEAAAAVTSDAVGKVGLSLELSKTKAWTPDSTVALPASLEARRVDNLTCLGNTLPFVAASRDLTSSTVGAAQVPVCSAGSPAPVQAALEAFTDKLRTLRAKGLRVQTAWALFRTYVNGASNHILRGCWAGAEWCEQYDQTVLEFVEALLEATLDTSQRDQLWLSLKRGGMGLASAKLRRSAAYLGSWEQCFSDVALSQGSASAQALLAQAPVVAATMEAAGADLRASGVWRYHPEWARCFDVGRARRQKLYGATVQGSIRKKLLAQLGADDQVDVRSAGGQGGAFLLPPSQPSHLMPDDHFVVASRLRLRVPYAAHLGQAGPGLAPQCCHRYVQSQTQCNGVLDGRGLHGLLCKGGGGVDGRHNAIRDWLAALIRQLTGQAAPVEQLVPKWDRVVRVDGTDTLEHARLDVVFNNCHGQRVYLDVVVPTAGSTNPETVRSRAAKDGAAAARAADGKRVRYPGPDLVPFAVEALGRPGRDAAAFLRSLAPSEPEARSAVLGAAWQSLSVVLQMGNAELLLSASGAGGARCRAAQSGRRGLGAGRAHLI